MGRSTFWRGSPTFCLDGFSNILDGFLHMSDMVCVHILPVRWQPRVLDVFALPGGGLSMLGGSRPFS